MADQLFTQAPEEVTRYFDAKESVPSFDWRDVVPHEHATAFTVAKTAGFDVLDDIRTATRDAIAQARPFGEFVDELEPTLRKKGWWGYQVVTDPDTGRPRRVRLGSLNRLRTIYWANTTTARAAGEWERIQRTKRGLPFLVYELSTAERRRPEHLGWVGVILRVDDTFWLTHYPPNGWLCQCRVRQISRREAEALGYDPDTPAPEIEARPWTNRQTGETVQVPRGIDPGWQSHPGITRQRNVSAFLTERLDALPAHVRRAAIADIVGDAKFKALQRGDIPFNGWSDRSPANLANGQLALPVAVLPERLRSLMGSKVGVVVLSNADAHKQLRRLGGAQIDATPFDQVQDALESGSVFEDATSQNDLIVQTLIDGVPWAAILHFTPDRGTIYLKSLRQLRENQIGPTSRNIPID